MFMWVKFGEAENPQRRCFCMDVTCDNLLDAVKRTIEEETPGLIKRREAELILKLREVTADEQQLAAKAARSEAPQQPIPPETPSALDLVRSRKSSTERKLLQLQAALGTFKGLGQSDIDLIEPSSGTLQKLTSNPRKKAVSLLRAGHTYETVRLDKKAAGPSTPFPLIFSLSATAPSQAAPA